MCESQLALGICIGTVAGAIFTGLGLCLRRKCQQKPQPTDLVAEDLALLSNSTVTSAQRAAQMAVDQATLQPDGLRHREIAIRFGLEEAKRVRAEHEARAQRLGLLSHEVKR